MKVLLSIRLFAIALLLAGLGVVVVGGCAGWYAVEAISKLVRRKARA